MKHLEAALKQYHDLLQKIVSHGVYHDDYRTGVGSWRLFGEQLKTSMDPGAFPVLTTKKVHFKSVAAELLWMLKGFTNVGWLRDHGCTIWDEWADSDGSLGPVYGAQWRGLGSTKIDQVALLQELLESPGRGGRRALIDAWSPEDLNAMALPPCHMVAQFHADEYRGKLHCTVYQRSADIFLGVPFNIAQYALFANLLCNTRCADDLTPGELTIQFGDLHLYETHVSQAMKQLGRSFKTQPMLIIDAGLQRNVWDHEPEMLSLVGYMPDGALHAPVAV